MRFGIGFILTLTASLVARADEQLPLLQAGGQTYTNVTITKVTATDVFFMYHGGMGNAKLKTLSPEWQKHFHYDGEKGKAMEQKQAENQANYHNQLLRQPSARAADVREAGSQGSAAPGKAMWRADLPGALKQAQSENKFVLLDFTGSDWCPWCIKFDEDVLSTPKFAAYASRHLELVKVDFPRHTPLPAAQQHANDALAAQFNVDGYPTYVLLNSAGKEVGRQVGYLAGGPDAFIAALEKSSGR